MNADAFRQLYDYHFAENRKLWDLHIAELPEATFAQPEAYSLGSIRDQIVHLMSVDDSWFSDLRGAAIPSTSDPAKLQDRASLRAHWDRVEQHMRGYLAELRDGMLFKKPLEGEDADLFLWQVLLHVVNHGTDHRAQILRLLGDHGVETGPQDYIFYVYDNP